MLYATFDETEVYRFDMAIYGEMTEYYVENRRIPYPKVKYNTMRLLIFICNRFGFLWRNAILLCRK